MNAAYPAVLLPVRSPSLDKRCGESGGYIHSEGDWLAMGPCDAQGTPCIRGPLAEKSPGGPLHYTESRKYNRINPVECYHFFYRCDETSKGSTTKNGGPVQTPPPTWLPT